MINCEIIDTKVIPHSSFTASIFVFFFSKYVLSLRAGGGRLVQWSNDRWRACQSYHTWLNSTFTHTHTAKTYKRLKSNFITYLSKNTEIYCKYRVSQPIDSLILLKLHLNTHRTAVFGHRMCISVIYIGTWLYGVIHPTLIALSDSVS